MSLREPCEHGHYVSHLWSDADQLVTCPGGHILTDAEALRTLLYDVCERCGGSEIGVQDLTYYESCPVCGGSGRTPKAGVVRAPDFGREFVSFPASWLEGEGDS